MTTQLERIEPRLTHNGSDLGVALDRALRADIALDDLYSGKTYRSGSTARRRVGEALDLIREARRILMALDEQRAKKEAQPPRYTVHAANHPTDLWYVRDETTQQPVARTEGDWLFQTQREAAAFAATKEAQR